MTKKKILTVIGARPQIIKAAALSRAIQTNFQTELEEILVHTGQHYDENMSAIFFSELGIPEPHYNLAVGSGSHGEMTAAMLSGLEAILQKEKPAAVIIYGDTNSTIAAALAAVKIHIPVVHIEAGLRSFNKAMPEEINRIAADHMSSLLFVPTQAGMRNLEREGFELNTKNKANPDQPNVYHCGDIMYDNSLYFAQLSRLKSQILKELNLIANNYILCTIHRDSNTDDPAALQGILIGLLELIAQTGLRVVLPIHPRTKNKINTLLSSDFRAKLDAEARFIFTPPASFLDMIALEENARLIITDSGGVQKEAYFFAKPCVILRDQTEWVEIVETGAAVLTGAHTEKIISASQRLLNQEIKTGQHIFGDGHAAEFICQKILSDL
ncbi:MAG: non-hydrolyzing UDP-N-acetylglucosamine 2-epimerase [Flavobacteriales bacterium]